jgi:chromosome segregation ATPase
MSIKKWIANIVNLEVDQSDTARELKKLVGALDMAYHRIHKLEERADAFHRRAEDLEVADSAVMIVRASSRISKLEDRTDDALTQLSRQHDSLIGMRNSHTTVLEELTEEIEEVKVSFNNLDIPKAEDIIGDDEVEEWIKNAVVTAVEDLEISVAVC